MNNVRHFDIMSSNKNANIIILKLNPRKVSDMLIRRAIIIIVTWGVLCSCICRSFRMPLCSALHMCVNRTSSLDRSIRPPVLRFSCSVHSAKRAAVLSPRLSRPSNTAHTEDLSPHLKVCLIIISPNSLSLETILLCIYKFHVLDLASFHSNRQYIVSVIKLNSIMRS